MRFLEDLDGIEGVPYPPKINRVGETYGEITVLEYVGKVIMGNGFMGPWIVKCLCSCGEIKYAKINEIIIAKNIPCYKVQQEKKDKDIIERKRIVAQNREIRKKATAKKNADISCAKLVDKERKKEEKRLRDAERRKARREYNDNMEQHLRERGDISHEVLCKTIKYNPETGVFTWLKRAGKYLPGSVAGHLNKRTHYLQIGIKGFHYQAHRLAWFYVNGYFPENQIDHINRVRDDNRLINLREVSPSCNMRNQNISSSNSSGITGVRWDSNGYRWQANIGVNGRVCPLGTYKNFDDAVKARWLAEVEYDYQDCCTVSTSYNYLRDNNLLPD